MEGATRRCGKGDGGGGGGNSAVALVAFAAGERDWRGKLWQYISRDNLLKSLGQFQQVLALFCTLAKLPAASIPASVSVLGAQTFKSVLRGGGSHGSSKKARARARQRGSVHWTPSDVKKKCKVGLWLFLFRCNYKTIKT